MADRFDWDELKKTWRDDPKDLPDLAPTLRRRTRAIWVLTVLDVLATIALLGLFIWFLGDSPQLRELVFVGAVGVLLVLCWTIVLRIRRGTWRLDTEAPGAMLELAIRRCRASIRLAQFNLVALGVGFVTGFAVRWLLNPQLELEHLKLELSDPSRLMLTGTLVLVALAWGLGAEWYRRRKSAELDRLLELRREISDEREEGPATSQ